MLSRDFSRNSDDSYRADCDDLKVDDLRMPGQRPVHLHTHTFTSAHVCLVLLLKMCPTVSLRPPHLSCAEQDGFGLVTFLRLIGRLAHQSVSDPVPERVAFHGACRETRFYLSESVCALFYFFSSVFVFCLMWFSCYNLSDWFVWSRLKASE